MAQVDLHLNPLDSETEEDTVQSDNSPIRTDKRERICPSALLTAAAQLSINTASGMSLRGSLIVATSQATTNLHRSSIQRPQTVMMNMKHLNSLIEHKN